MWGVAHNEDLVLRVRAALADEAGISERRMFGGICFLVDGKMVLGTATSDLMVRVGKDAYAEALARPHVKPMDFTGRPLAGFVYVAPEGLRTATQLRRWIAQAVEFVRSLPPPARKKKAKPKPPRFPPPRLARSRRPRR